MQPNNSTSLKMEWASEKREAFITKLLRLEWRVVRPDLFQRKQKRIEVDDYGIFLWEIDSFGKWVRTHGLSNGNIDGYKGNIIKFLGPDNRRLISFRLAEADWVWHFKPAGEKE